MTGIRKKKILPKYQPHDRVYVISFYEPGGKTEDGDSERYHARIYKVYIKSIDINPDGVQYWVGDSINDDTKDWGDFIPEEVVNHNFEELIKYLKKKWKI